MNFAIRRRGSRERITPLPDSDLQVLSENTRLRAWSLTILATVALLLTLVHRQTLAALAATVCAAMSLSDVQYGWLSTGMAAAFLAGSLPAARLTQRLGPQLALALTVGATTLVVGMHSLVSDFSSLLVLRIAMGFAAASAMPAATQTLHRVLPFKDRARGIALLYLGASLGSAVCAPLGISLESRLGWRLTFLAVAAFGSLWVPIWAIVSNLGQHRGAHNSLGPSRESVEPLERVGVRALLSRPGVLRGTLLVAAAAPVNLIMLIWAAKYLVRDHAVTQHDLGLYLWLPALSFGAGSLLFGELRSRSARKRATARPPRRLVAIASTLCVFVSTTPWTTGPATAILMASLAMLGAGGLYTLATSDMLAHTPRQVVPVATGLTTVTQSLVYVVASPLIGKLVEHFGSYDWVMRGAGLWVFPCVLIWLMDASLQSRLEVSPKPSGPLR